MPHGLPRVTAKEMIAVVEKLGFIFSRQSGSHKIYKNKGGVRVTIPFHSGKTLHLKIVKSIMKDADLTPERFRELV